jgi:ubiquitin-like 1-activating enzyme E1 B
MEEAAQTEMQKSCGHHQFFKAFNENIFRLLQLETLWEKRAKPKVRTLLCVLFWFQVKQMLDLNSLLSSSNGEEARQNDSVLLSDQRIASDAETAQMFVDSCNRLQVRGKKRTIFSFRFCFMQCVFQVRKNEAGSLDWDKDDEDALNFVTAAANLRGVQCLRLFLVCFFIWCCKQGNATILLRCQDSM